ncbi:odorant receptor 45b-like [Venturia canescens]|uniref:odorant receptor 45b-like n=1 Tax=Venturia canescens TaxID=32260 RepID=UPI001C9C49CD|nr:odorant receptor 45b-like [Venturia canescens]
MASRASAKVSLWNSDTVYELGLCRALEHTLGIWPTSCQDIFSKVRLSIVAFLEISMAMNLLREILTGCVIVDEMLNFLALAAYAIMALLKVGVLRINRTKMELLIKSAVDDWSTIEDSSTRETMRKYARTGRFVFIFQSVSGFLSCVLIVWPSFGPFVATLKSPENRFERSSAASFHNYSNFSSPLLHEEKDIVLPWSLPMGTSCFTYDIPLIFYALFYTLQTIQLFSTCAGNVGTDIYFFSISMHVCGQFELLKMRFENFGEIPDFCVCHEQVRALVRRHNHLMELSNNFEDSFNLLILAQLLTNALIMSLLGIQLIMSIETGDGTTAILALISFYILSLQLFLYSYAGDYLMSQIEKIRFAAYCGPWYDLSPTIVKDLMFVMCRSNRTFNLTAGKVVCMNMDNFKNIFKTMASYFSVLKIMFDV